MKIIVDADGCPVTKITLEISKSKNISTLIISNTCHIFDVTNYENATHILADKGNDSADFLIINKSEKGDIIVTQDYALASMCLAKNCNAINQNGFLYTKENMDELLFRRHISKKLRKAGKKNSKIKKRTQEEDDKFAKNLLKLIDFLKN